MIEAHKIGLSVTVFADNRSSPAYRVCDDFIESSFTDLDALSKFESSAMFLLWKRKIFRCVCSRIHF